MKRPVLGTRKDVVSAVICSYPGGRAYAAADLGMKLKKFDNQAYENAGSRPLTDEHIFRLEQQAGTAFLPCYVATMYGGMFVPVAEPESLDNIELYTMCVQTAAKRGTVDHIIAQALEDGVIDKTEADAILKAESLHMAARHAEVLAVLQLHAKRPTPRGAPLAK